MVEEPVTSLCLVGGGIGKEGRPELPRPGGGLGTGGRSELPLACIAIDDDDLLTRDESGNHMLWLARSSDCEPVPSDRTDWTVERWGFQRSCARSNVRWVL